jgi:perosamine synthetase
VITIPVSKPSITIVEERSVRDAVRAGVVSGSGEIVERFERQWAAMCGTEHAVAVSSGTAALHLVLLGMGVRPGDEVVVPALTYVAVANAVRHAGAVPVVADVCAKTWCLDPVALGEAISPRTVGVIPVHAYGHPAAMAEISEVARTRGLWVVEDGAEAHLARCDGRVVGGLANAAAFSFYANKILTTGEGGAVTTSDAALADRVRALRNQGVLPGRDDRYSPSLIGLGQRMSGLAAALGCAQLTRAAELTARRSAAVQCYRAHLPGVTGVSEQPVAPGAVPAPWLFSLLLDRTTDRVSVAADLLRRGIETRPLFPPLNTVPAATQRDATPVAATLSRHGISLPLFPDLTEADIAYVVDALGQATRGR